MLRKWVLIGLVVMLLLSFGTVIGCGESNVDFIVGKYMRQNSTSEYLTMKIDGTYQYINEEDEVELAGEWWMKGNEIRWTLGDFIGGGKVDGNIITDYDGAVWVLAYKYVNQDNASEYLVMKADGTYDYTNEEDGVELTGEWDVEGDKIIWTSEDFMGEGTIEGNIITDYDGTVWVLEE